MFKTRSELKKEYLCVVNGRVKSLKGECVQLTHWMKSRQNKPTLVQDKLSDGFQEAKLSFKELAVFNSTSASRLVNTEQTALVVELLSGRKHQIRAQLAKIGHSIVGDSKYGASQAFKDR